MIYSFEPMIDDRCKILILGTMPSVKSLEIHQYYGNKQNQFWKLLYALFDEKWDESYEGKRVFLLKHHVAIWDVLHGCHREGSSDLKIKNPVANDFETLFSNYPKIDTVFFNGSKAEELFMKLVKSKILIRKDIRFFRLPSSSPAHAIPFEDKLEQWKCIISVL